MREVPERARRLLHPGLQLALGGPDRANILRGARSACRFAAPIQLPGGDDDLFLHRDEIVDLRIRRAATPYRRPDSEPA